MAKIKNISASWVINGSGKPSIKSVLILDDNRQVEFLSSSSDNDFDINKSINIINTLIGPKLINVDPIKQSEIDGWLHVADDTKDKSKLGKITLYTVSCLMAKAASLSLGIPLYKYLNQIFQKRTALTVNLEKIPVTIVPILKSNFNFHLIPSSSMKYEQSLQMLVKALGVLRKEYANKTFESSIDSIEAILKTLDQIEARLGGDIFLGIDFMHSLKKDNFAMVVNNLIKKYMPLMIISPVEKNDPDLLKTVSEMLAKETYIVSDDLNPDNLKSGYTTYLLKPSSIATLTETFDMANTLKKNNLNYIISIDSEETSDSLLADLSVAMQSEFVYFGYLDAGESSCKYNRLLEIKL